MRHYKCPEYECDAPDNCCLFCKHCTDVFWDYTNGPYMFMGDCCDGNFETCGMFDEEVEDPEESA